MEERIGYAIGVGSKKFLLVLLAVLVFSSVTVPLFAQQTTEQDKASVARKWMKVGLEQYKLGLYGPAEKSFVFAKHYQDYLTQAEQQSLGSLLEDAKNATGQRKAILEHINTAGELVKEEKYAQAKQQLESIKDNKFLMEEEKALISSSLEKIQGRLGEEKKSMIELYNASVDLFNSGQLEQARPGFVKVAKSGLLETPKGYTANDYLAKVDKALSESAEAKQETKVIVEPDAMAEPQNLAKPEAVTAELQVEETKKDQDSYIAQVQQRIARTQGYVKAVVNDTMNKVNACIETNDYDNARVYVEDCERVVQANHLTLGDHQFKQYCDELSLLSERVANGHAALLKAQADARRIAVLGEQIEFRKKQEAERANHVADLMDNAETYQLQQRYEEALGQLQLLLAIDPQNDRALIQKQTLEDLITYRKSLRIQQKRDSERVELLQEVDASKIPYSEEMEHPDNWAQLVAKRDTKTSSGQSSADLEVYNQLDQVVDLSALSPEMSLKEAIDELKNSVDPALKIVVLWNDLFANADIDQTTPINMDAQPTIRLGTALELLLKSVSGGFTEVSYTIENGVITVGTVGSLPVTMEARVYDITVLLGKKADYFSLGGNRNQSGRGGSSGGSSGSSGSGGTQVEDFDDYEEDNEEDTETRQERNEASKARETALMTLIQETIDPESWYDLGGEGTIKMYEQKKLIVYQTAENHRKVKELLKELTQALGHEVAIESRFLLVNENYIQDIGLDLDFVFRPSSDNWGLVQVNQGHYTAAAPVDHGFEGSFAGARGLDLSASYWGSILGNLQVNLLLRALQGHSEAVSLTAPKVTVLSGESANFRSSRVIRFALPPDQDFYDSNYGAGGSSSARIRPRSGRVSTRVQLNVTPTITPDKLHVILNIAAELQDFLGFQISEYQIPSSTGNVITIQQTLPQTERSSIRTRVSVPDCGTLLLGGMKLTAETEREAGVPILSKLPILGPAFSTRSKIKDNKVLLILVKPTIILQEEKDAEALDSLENIY